MDNERGDEVHRDVDRQRARIRAPEEPQKVRRARLPRVQHRARDGHDGVKADVTPAPGRVRAPHGVEVSQRGPTVR